MGSSTSAECSDPPEFVPPSRSEASMNKPDPIKVAVIGAGAFGTAMAVLAARNGHEVAVWCRNAEQREAINTTHRNDKAKGIGQHELPENVVAVGSLEEAMRGAKIILHSLPAQTTPGFIKEHRGIIPEDAVFCSTSKGLFLEGKCLLGDAMREAFDRQQPLAFLSGPSFAAQIISKQPTVVVVASAQLEYATTVQRALSNLDFRIYTTEDTVGVELGGSLKNPLAIGAGMIEGKGLGINTMALYLTRAKSELQQLAIAMGGQPETVNGLSGIGDLMLTAFGDLSRNRMCGMRLVKGESLADITSQMTVEGVPTAKVAVHFADMCNLEVPIFRTVAGILDGSIEVDQVQGLLMTRALGTEVPMK